MLRWSYSFHDAKKYDCDDCTTFVFKQEWFPFDMEYVANIPNCLCMKLNKIKRMMYTNYIQK